MVKKQILRKVQVLGFFFYPQFSKLVMYKLLTLVSKSSVHLIKIGIKYLNT